MSPQKGKPSPVKSSRKPPIVPKGLPPQSPQSLNNRLDPQRKPSADDVVDSKLSDEKQIPNRKIKKSTLSSMKQSRNNNENNKKKSKVVSSTQNIIPPKHKLNVKLDKAKVARRKKEDVFSPIVLGTSEESEDENSDSDSESQKPIETLQDLFNIFGGDICDEDEYQI